MGVSTDAILAYGYDLGGDEGGWKIRELVDDEPQLDWYNPDDEDEEGFIKQAETRLLTAAGFTETDYKVPGFFDRKRAAEAQIGVEFDSYCSGDYPLYLIATKRIVVARGYIEHLDLDALAAEPRNTDWDEHLVNALRVLGITPLQPQPSWMLCSYWG